MTGFLQTACSEAAQRVAEASRLVPLEALRDRAAELGAPPSLHDALAAVPVAVIAEIKRASPSRGHLAWIPDPAAHAEAYVAGGAAAVSVLTEPRHFHGTLGDLAQVTGAVEVPVIRKDFVVDAYQVWEARGAGAAAVLLIVDVLESAALAQLLSVVVEAGLEALCEVHDTAAAARIPDALEAAGYPKPPVIGVNARDLTTLAVDPERFAAVVGSLPDGALAVAESGVSGPDGIRRAAGAGAGAILVGEHVATASDPTAAVRTLVAAGRADAWRT